MSAVTPEKDPHPIHVAVGAFVMASAADTAITYHMLSNHRDLVSEANPLLRPLQNSPATLSVVKTAMTITTSYLLIHEHKRHPWATFWIAVGGGACYSVVAIRNYRLNP